MATSDWATQQLAGFLAVLTGAADDREAETHALERLAESFEADAGAFIKQQRVTSSLGWQVGRTPDAELLAAVNSDQAHAELSGVGACEIVVVPVDRDESTTLFLARSNYPFSAEETGLLRGMARVLALGLRLLGTVAAERRQAAENQLLLLSLRERQLLSDRLSQIQHRITARDPLQEILDDITAGAAQLLKSEMAVLHLVDDSEFLLMASSLGIVGEQNVAQHRIPLTTSLGGRAVLEDRLCVIDNFRCFNGDGELDSSEHWSAVAAPIHTEGRAIGSLVVATRQVDRSYLDSERELILAFAEHASLALNQARSHQAMADALEDAKHRALHDELTGLPNRACFYDRTDQALRLAARDGSATAVLLFDLNRFKEINDTLGHKYGDRVLREIGPRFRQGLRESDTLARLGGDEFCVLLTRVNGIGDALEVSERILGLLEEPFEIDGMTMDVEASCGIAIAPVDGDNVDVLLQHADVAMYVAKHLDAKVVAYNDELNVNSRARLALVGKLRTGIASDQLVLFYQPKAALGGGHVEGVEALVRWQHPTLGLVPPDEFIPLAAHTGLIKPLTTWVLNTALRQLHYWREQADGPISEEMSMAVNLSARSLLDEGFPAEVVAALERWKIPAHLLELEITESMIMPDPRRAHHLLTELAAVGVKLSIDDFGTGYSSLAYLKNLPVNQLKIDRTFVCNMNRDPLDTVIVRSMIELGHNLGLRVIAEGIEDGETWEQLASLGCDSGQGYLLARPMPAGQVESWMQAKALLPVGITF